MRDPRIETLIGLLDRALFERLAPDTDAWPIARGIFDALKNPRLNNSLFDAAPGCKLEAPWRMSAVDIE